MIAPRHGDAARLRAAPTRAIDAGARRGARCADAVAGTFNAISVDGDMSTNDTVLLLASGVAGNAHGRARSRRRPRASRARSTEVLEELARLVVLDGEGAPRLVEVDRAGRAARRDAQRVARAIANSTLCKAAFAGGDPNWGRFVCAAGTAGVPLDPDRIDVTIDGVLRLAARAPDRRRAGGGTPAHGAARVSRRAAPASGDGARRACSPPT